MRRAAASLVGAVVLLGGCPRAPTVVPDVVPDPVEPTTCGDGSAAFDDAAALPADAALVAVLAGDSAALDAPLARLQTHVQGGASGLSVPTAFALQQWRWEVPLVLRTFAGLGIPTRSLAAVQLTGLGTRVGARVWATPLACAFETVTATLRRDFDVQDTGGTAIATPRDRAAFAYDVVVRPEAILLCPQGSARVVLAAWDRPVGTGISLRQRVFELPPAAVRLAIRETGLLGPGASDSGTADRLLRVDADGVDATLAP